MSEAKLLKKCFEIKQQMEVLEKEYKKVKKEVVEKIQKMDGRNKEKVLYEGNYEAKLKYKRNISWDEDKAINYFSKLGFDEVIKTKVTFDLVIIDKLIEKRKLDKSEIDKVSTTSWKNYALYIKKI